MTEEEKLISELENGEGEEQVAALFLRAGYFEFMNDRFGEAKKDGIPTPELVKGHIRTVIAGIFAHTQGLPLSKKLVLCLTLKSLIEKDVLEIGTKALMED